MIANIQNICLIIEEKSFFVLLPILKIFKFKHVLYFVYYYNIHPYRGVFLNLCVCYLIKYIPVKIMYIFNTNLKKYCIHNNTIIFIFFFYNLNSIKRFCVIYTFWFDFVFSKMLFLNCVLSNCNSFYQKFCIFYFSIIKTYCMQLRVEV